MLESNLYIKPGGQSFNSSQPDRRNGTIIYTMSSSILEKDIEQHPDFKTIWKYNLAKKKGTSETAPSDYTTTASTELDKQDWKWVEEVDSLPEGWIIYAQKTKKNVKSYPVPSVSVHKKQYYTSKTSAASAASTVGSISTPGETFGLGSTNNWLVTSANVYYEDKFWVAELDYQYADSWDTDIY